jgi:predicted ribosomally synthesized peptide with SipW-like signal peptide/uncharacterized repeat protein (TIGR01451 family)
MTDRTHGASTPDPDAPQHSAPTPAAPDGPPPRRRWWRGRVRVILALGLVAGLGVAGTRAYWSDLASVDSNPIQSGTLDLTIDGSLTGQGGTLTKTSFGLTAMVPGESVASTVTIANAGSVPLTYTSTATATGTLPSAMTFQVFSGGSATNTGTAASGNRTGACTGTSISTSTLTTTPQSVISTARSLTGGGSEVICIVAKLLTSAGNNLQGLSTTATFTFNAKQVGAP